MNNAVHMCREEEASAWIFLFYRNGFHRYIFCVELNTVLVTDYAQYLLEHTCQKLSVTTNFLGHKIHIYRRTSFKAIHCIKQRTAFQQKIVFILTHRNSIEQTLIEVSCQKIHLFIACLVHQIEQACLYRLAIVLLFHSIQLLFLCNSSICWQLSDVWHSLKGD